MGILIGVLGAMWPWLRAVNAPDGLGAVLERVPFGWIGMVVLSLFWGILWVLMAGWAASKL